MPPLKRENMPLTAFDPKYYDIILEGTKRRVEIPQKSRKDANRLRHLLTTYRARYRREWQEKGDPRWEVLYGAIIGLSDDKMSTVVRPRAEEASELLAGLTFVEGETSDTSSDAIHSEPLVVDPLAEFEGDHK